MLPEQTIRFAVVDADTGWAVTKKSNQVGPSSFVGWLDSKHIGISTTTSTEIKSIHVSELDEWDVDEDSSSGGERIDRQVMYVNRGCCCVVERNYETSEIVVYVDGRRSEAIDALQYSDVVVWKNYVVFTSKILSSVDKIWFRMIDVETGTVLKKLKWIPNNSNWVRCGAFVLDDLLLFGTIDNRFGCDLFVWNDCADKQQWDRFHHDVLVESGGIDPESVLLFLTN